MVSLQGYDTKRSLPISMYNIVILLREFRKHVRMTKPRCHIPSLTSALCRSRGRDNLDGSSAMPIRNVQKVGRSLWKEDGGRTGCGFPLEEYCQKPCKEHSRKIGSVTRGYRTGRNEGKCRK